MAARKRTLHPEVEAVIGRVLQEGKNALARASSAMFASLAQDAKRVPDLVREEAVKVSGTIDAFIASIASEPAGPLADDADPKGRETSRQTPRAKKRRRKPAKKGAI
jgi:hypothetical protein